jgi:hypothetical protein
MNMKQLTLTTHPEKLELDNSGTKLLARLMSVDAIQTAEPFVSLFPVREAVLADIVVNLKANGFDPSQPLHVWKEKSVLIDGHTRLRAAREAGWHQVPVYEHSFATEDEALNYAINCQRHRRNLTDAELFTCIQELDKRQGHGGKRVKSPPGLLNTNETSRQQTARAVGASQNKVLKVRAITDKGTSGLLAQVKSGELSINQAYHQLADKPKVRALRFPLTFGEAAELVTEPGWVHDIRVVDEFETERRFVIHLEWLPGQQTSEEFAGALKAWLESVCK